MVPGGGPSSGRDGESCQGGELSEDQVVDDRRPQDCEDDGDDQTSVGVVQANGRSEAYIDQGPRGGVCKAKRILIRGDGVWGVPDKPDRAYDRCLGDQQPDCRCHRERQHSKWGKKKCDVPGIDESEREGATVGGAIPPKRLAHCRPDRRGHAGAIWIKVLDDPCAGADPPGKEVRRGTEGDGKAVRGNDVQQKRECE